MKDSLEASGLANSVHITINAPANVAEAQVSFQIEPLFLNCLFV
jgi:hypothetical protein